MSVMENMTPMGTIARLPDRQRYSIASTLHAKITTDMYVRVVIGTLWRESSVFVQRAMYWVMIVPKT